MTFPRSVGQIPIFYNEKSTGRPFDPNSKWTSKYIDEPNSPLFPFGFGLSYTTFSYSEPKADKAVFKKRENLQITVNVTNTGSRAGEEVVQLYVRDLVGSVTRPVKELKGFQKIMLKAGESRDVKFTLTERDLSFWRGDMTFGAEPGEFDIMVGGNSADLKKVRVKMTE
jgi:beta-glucosidase